MNNSMDNGKVKLIGLKALTYVLIIVSFVMFGQGWLTFESAKTRRNVESAVKSFVQETEEMSESDLNELDDYLADYDLDVSGEVLIKKLSDAVRILGDAKISPKELSVFMSRASWMLKKTKDLFFGSVSKDLDELAAKVHVYSFILNVMYIVTILSFIGSLIAVFFGVGAGTFAYGLMNIIQFIIICIVRSRMNDVNSMMSTALSSIPGFYLSGVENYSMRFCAPAFVSLACAILSCAAWGIAVYSSHSQGEKIPGLISTVMKSGGDSGVSGRMAGDLAGNMASSASRAAGNMASSASRVAENMASSAGRVVSSASQKAGGIASSAAARMAAPGGKAIVCACGTRLGKGDKFCPSCGRPAPVPQVRKCPGCGAQLEEGDLFCSECGRKIDNSPAFGDGAGMPEKKKMVCAVCGKELEDGALFCSGCGSPVRSGSPDPSMSVKLDRGGSPAMNGTPAVGGSSAVSGSPAMGGGPAMSGSPAIDGSPAMGGSPLMSMSPDLSDSPFSGDISYHADDEDRTVMISSSAPTALRTRTIVLTDQNDPTRQAVTVLQEGQSILAGRNKEKVDFVVDFDRSISREHCRFSLVDGEVYVEDAGSSFNTYIDNQIVNYPMRLDSGSVLKMGNCSLLVEILDQ